MANIKLQKRGRKRGKDSWSALIALPRDSNGIRKYERLTFAGTKKEAEKALIDRLSEIQSGHYVSRDATTVAAYFEEWLAGARGSLSGKTWERLEQILRVHVRPVLGAIPLQRLTAARLNKAYADWRNGGLSAQTVVHHHRFIHRVLAQAVREGRVRQNVAATADKPGAMRREMRVLSIAEVNVLLERATPRFASLIALAVATGARRGELLGAKWQDLDFNRGTLSIRRSLEQTKAGVTEKTPKSGKSRILTLPVTTLETLRKRRLELAKQRVPSNDDYLFPDIDPAGAWLLRPWNPHKVTEGFRDLCRKAKIDGASFHSLRHTCASLLLAQEVHPKVVQEMLGHSSISITLDLYSHSTPSLQAEAAQRLDAILSGQPHAAYSTADSCNATRIEVGSSSIGQ